MTQASENLLIAKTNLVRSWGFIGHGSEDGRHWTGRRIAPSGWIEVWRTCDADCIALYNSDDTERSADEVFQIDWKLLGFTGEKV